MLLYIECVWSCFPHGVLKPLCLARKSKPKAPRKHRQGTGELGPEKQEAALCYILSAPRGGKAINLFCCFVVAFIYFFFHTLHCYCRDSPAAAKPGKPSKPLFPGKKQQDVSSGHYLSRELRGTAHQRPKPCLKSKENTLTSHHATTTRNSQASIA